MAQDTSTSTAPHFIYGTAWKEERSEELLLMALKAGFSSFDTANQRKHYHEVSCGKGLQKFLALGQKTREQIFIQTKFTFMRSQDSRLPYDPNAKISDQVNQSCESSLQHLAVDYLDSYILHGPHNFGTDQLSDEDWEAWRSLQGLHAEGKVKNIGISNVGLLQLQQLADRAKVMPKFVQNRCYANKKWDRDIRLFCKKNNIFYQGFSLLTANPHVLKASSMGALSLKYKKTPSQIVFRFCRDIGIIPLTGTSQLEHMKMDLSIEDFKLAPEEIALIENLDS
jgi:diketogulonate reductase-like aldo/keto reductase